MPSSQAQKAVVLDLAKIKGFEKFATKPKNVAVIAMNEKATSVVKGFDNFGNISVEEYRNINPLMVLNHKYLVITGAEKIFNEEGKKQKSKEGKIEEKKVIGEKTEVVEKTKASKPIAEKKTANKTPAKK